MEESIMRVVSKLMTGERFDRIVSGEREYRKRDSEMEELSNQLWGYNFTKEQHQAIDRLLSAGNACCAKYGELAYQQGAKDVVAILRELDLIKAV